MLVYCAIFIVVDFFVCLSLIVFDDHCILNFYDAYFVAKKKIRVFHYFVIPYLAHVAHCLNNNLQCFSSFIEIIFYGVFNLGTKVLF